MEIRCAFEMKASGAGESDRVATRGSEAIRPNRRTKCRILVVDDMPDTLTILRLFLSSQGFEVITADGVPKALICVQERSPDLIITDYSMPELTGLDLCRHLRSHRETMHIPIILHTGTELPTTAAPLYDVLCAKPADLAVLTHKVQLLLPHEVH